MVLRIATFNLENLDDGIDLQPPIEKRIQIMRPQLERVAADIICFQEVHSQVSANTRVLVALDKLLDDTSYVAFNKASTLTTSGKLYLQRNIVTLSRFQIISTQIIRDSTGPQPSYQMATATPPDAEANPVEWERPMLYTQIVIENNRILHLINVHFKSKLASNIPGQKINNFTWRTVSAWAEGNFISSMKRVGQALQARLLIDKIFDRHGLSAFIVIAGDFNAQADEVSLKAISGSVEETGNPDHSARMMILCDNNIPASARYSLFHLGKGQMLDHILVSRPFLRYFVGAEIHNEILPDESGAFRQDSKFPESDHAPVVAKFKLD